MLLLAGSPATLGPQYMSCHENLATPSARTRCMIHALSLSCFTQSACSTHVGVKLLETHLGVKLLETHVGVKLLAQVIIVPTVIM